jgi:hypothetical protein
MRLAIKFLLACASLVVGATGCSSGDNDKVSCVVKVGEAQTAVSLDTKVGASSVATVGSYSVTFFVVDGLQFEAEVRDGDLTVMKMTGGAVAGAAGSAPTPDGQLDFSCAR